ncbi:MAG TPA: NAD(+) kinase [bacterium]|nr:NAD(+) kinase [bacterium]
MKFAITGNTTKGIVKGVIPELLQWLSERKLDFILDRELANYLQLPYHVASDRLSTIAAACDFVIAFGGDGTILSTARAVGASATPIVGVNLGGLGFLTEVGVEELYPMLENIERCRYSIIERMVVAATVHDPLGEIRYHALNDVVIDRGGFSRVIRIDVYIDDAFLNTYIGDGIIVATPTGSTAYSLSSLGPILAPSVNCMIINPICPHSLTVRPVVIPDDSVVRVVPHGRESIITMSVDGQVNQQFPKAVNVEIILQKAEYSICCVQRESKNFYNLLRKKLNWGIDKRMS